MSSFSSELVSPLAQQVLGSQKVFMRPQESVTDYPRLRFGGDDFDVDLETGFDPEGPYDLEPDTVLIDHVISRKEGQGLATAALSNILVQARDLDYNHARMMIKTPRMAHIARALVELGYASSVGFEVYSYDSALPKSTQLVAASTDVSAAQAHDFVRNTIATTAELSAKTGETLHVPAYIRCGLKL